jgi:hypothetical protein
LFACGTTLLGTLQGVAFLMFAHVRPAADFIQRASAAYADIILIEAADVHAGGGDRIRHVASRCGVQEIVPSDQQDKE